MRVRPGVARPLSGRGLVLLPAGALLVHQIRYWLTYGSQASDELNQQGHAYLGSLVPWIVLLVAGGLGCFVARLARARRLGGDGGDTRPFVSLWATTAAGLVAIYFLQELVEGLFASGDPTSVAEIFGHGGWWSAPAAAAVSFAVVALLRVGRTLVQLAARSGRAPRSRTVVTASRRPADVYLAALPPLAYAAAGRAPPALLSG